jgi:hypothetical protein
VTLPPRTDPVWALVFDASDGFEKGDSLARKRYTVEQIITKLREAEVGLGLVAQGVEVALPELLGLTWQSNLLIGSENLPGTASSADVP